MTAGLNLSVQVWRFSFSDDDIGGAVPSGTMIYENIQARRAEQPAYQMQSADQGIESERLHYFMLYPATIVVLENDVIQIQNPPNHWDYQKFFRVYTVKRVGFHPNDPRGYILVSCKRSVEAHAIQ